MIKSKKHLIETLANALVEKDTLDILKIKEILGEKPYAEDPTIKQAIEEVI